MLIFDPLELQFEAHDSIQNHFFSVQKKKDVFPHKAHSYLNHKFELFFWPFHPKT